jgi:hypothetical protein
MRYVIVAPNSINDPFVDKIGKLRSEFMQNARVVNDQNEPENMQVISFWVHDIDYEIFDEKKTLNGSWASVLLFNEEILPDVRKTLLSLIQDKTKDVVHVDLGKSLVTLYIAYFCILEGINLNVSFHMPNPEDEKPVFNIGGESAYSNPRNNLRRYIATQVVRNAMTVFIDNPAIMQILKRLFPKINREIHIDPLLQILEENSSVESLNKEVQDVE